MIISQVSYRTNGPLVLAIDLSIATPGAWTYPRNYSAQFMLDLVNNTRVIQYLALKTHDL